MREVCYDLEKSLGIPYPMVRANQWTIVASVVLSCLTGSFMWLLIPFVSGLAGLITGFNPILRLARVFLLKPMTDYLREDAAQLRFNQVIAVCLLGIGLMGYVLHIMSAAYVASALVGIASGVAISGFCVGCFLRYQWTQFRYRRTI